MWAYHEALLATPVPRYTSYPTAAEFDESVDASDMATALAGVAAEEALSLYLHIPFCEQICWYCGCNTGRSNRPARLTAYLEALHEEIRLVGGMLGGRGKVRRIAFGGGSPNAIDPALFLDLLQRLHQSFNLTDPTISVEIDPRNFTAEWASALKQAGVSRASLGVQTLSEAIQRRIGRVQPVAMIEQMVEQLRTAGVKSINFDLMYGLPGQELIDLEGTIRLSDAMLPERVALFGYAHVPHLIPRQRQIDASHLPDARARFDQAMLGHVLLVGQGYRPIGFDHFAKPHDDIAVVAKAGKLRRNFQGFTEDQADILIGLGASSISQFPNLLVQNEKNAGRYRMNVLAGRLAHDRGVRRDGEDQRRGAIIEALLCSGKADFSALVDRDLLRCALQPFADRSLVTISDYQIALNEGARPYARTIAARFDRHRQIAPRQFSSAI